MVRPHTGGFNVTGNLTNPNKPAAAPPPKPTFDGAPPPPAPSASSGKKPSKNKFGGGTKPNPPIPTHTTVKGKKRKLTDHERTLGRLSFYSSVVSLFSRRLAGCGQTSDKIASAIAALDDAVSSLNQAAKSVETLPPDLLLGRLRGHNLIDVGVVVSPRARFVGDYPDRMTVVKMVPEKKRAMCRDESDGTLYGIPVAHIRAVTT
jgi:hypothetical protein